MLSTFIAKEHVSMEIGIIGLPQTGKKTLFKLLTQGGSAAVQVAAGSRKKANIGLSKVYDERLDQLVQRYNPKAVTPAVITYLLLPKLSKNSEENREAFTAINTVDAICHVVRAFDDDSVFHVDGAVDPLRDIEYVQSELLLADLIFTETRIERLTKDIKRKNDPAKQKELDLMNSIVKHLDNEKPLRTMPLNEDEQKILNAFPFLTRKNMITVLNVNENDLASDELLQGVKASCERDGTHCVQVSCKIEEELASIEDKEERDAFCKELGIHRSALEKITRLSYYALNRVSFFTVGEDEVRAWTVRNNAYAPQAGGAIHSDIERGFIRAEHMRFEDLISLGSEQKVKDAGKFSLKGKEYQVQDGDILHFLFNT
jgi:GTP-binding protein YchF